MSEYLNIVTLQTGQQRRSARAEVSRDLIERVKPLLGKAITSRRPVDLLGSGWWLKARRAIGAVGELRDLSHAVLRADVSLEFELWPRMFDTQPVICTVEPHSDGEAAATLKVGVQGPGIERHIECRIPTESDLERSIAWAWLDSLKDTNSV